MQPQPDRSIVGGMVLLQDLANVGEFPGGVAVIVSLAYLAIQILHNTRFLCASTFQAVADSISEIGYRAGVDPELGRIFVDGMQGGVPLTETEQRQFHFILPASVRRLENASYLLAPGGSPWWKERKAWFTDYCLTVIDDLVAHRPPGFETSGNRPAPLDLSWRR
jgi:hypothetical protein